MKCPVCGKWNQSSFPHCVYCGTPLTQTPGEVPSWAKAMEGKDRPKTYLRVDDSGEIESRVDYRDALATEMAELKKRKNEGEAGQRRMRERAASNQEKEMAVRTTSNREDFFAQAPQPEEHRATWELAQENASQTPPISPIRYRTVYRTEDGQEQVVTSRQREEAPMFDSYSDSSMYYSNFGDSMRFEKPFEPLSQRKKLRTPRNRGRRFLRGAAIFFCVAVILGIVGYLGYQFLTRDRSDGSQAASVMMTIDEDGLTAHSISIPGRDGERITIRELRTSAIVTGGYATFVIADHQFYDDSEDYLQDTMSVTLSPYLVEDNGRQTALEQIHYMIDIPISPIELDTPGSLYQVVSTALYNIVFYVQEGSSVTINGVDYSDLVNGNGGKVSYNATVQPIGENNIHIVVRSQYCRENTLDLVLYREKQAIPLDLASDVATSTSSSTGTITVRGTTLPGAVVKVLSSYRDLDITNTATDGSFSFVAVLDQIGDNTIIITADYPGKETTRVEHNIYYVPNIDIYSRKAWDLVSQYTDLMDNMEMRRKASQIYVCKGEITSIDTTKPQRCFMNIGTEENPLSVYIENSSKTTWELGAKYRVYGDVYGMYDGKPWLVVRYTYREDE